MRTVWPHQLVRRSAREVGETPDPAVVLGSREDVGREGAHPAQRIQRRAGHSAVQDG